MINQGSTTYASELSERFHRAWRNVRRAMSSGSRAVVTGVDQRGGIHGGEERALGEFRTILINSGRFYRFGSSIVHDASEEKARLINLTCENQIADIAGAIVSRYLVFEDRCGARHFPTSTLLRPFLTDPDLFQDLPEIQHYATRPTFDRDFQICAPGWNRESGYLIHAPELPSVPDWQPGNSGRAVDRLPPRLRDLLEEFCWATEGDLANTVAMILTGLLINHFVEDPHPVGLVEASRCALGKTLLVDTIGTLLDGVAPGRLQFAEDNEVQKLIGAALQNDRSSILFFDNIRGKINSTVLEAQSLAPTVTARRLGSSNVISRQNAYLWFLTGNNCTLTRDMLSRCVPIRLAYEGEPRGRSFQRNPIAYARENRLEILAELVGMVERWRDATTPLPRAQHRCGLWSQVMRGILEMVGLGDAFLANIETAQDDMDEDRADLRAMAEILAATPTDPRHVRSGDNLSGKGMRSSGWLREASQTPRLGETINVTRVMRGKETVIGRFLRQFIGTEIHLPNESGYHSACLRRLQGSSNSTLYYFEFSSRPAPTAEPPAPPSCPWPADPEPISQVMSSSVVVSSEGASPAVPGPQPPSTGVLSIGWLP